MNGTFYTDLTQYVKTHDVVSANKVIMQELGKILAKDKENFITLLRYSDIAVPTEPTDATLIDLFIENINKNRKLMIGTALLVNQHNKSVGFDGEEEVSDTGVKAVHKVMYNFFGAHQGEETSNAGGAAVGAIAQGVGSLANLGSEGIRARQKNKFGVLDMAERKQQAQQELVKSALEQRRLQQESIAKQKEQKDKTRKVIIIGGISLAAIALIIAGVYIVRKRNK